MSCGDRRGCYVTASAVVSFVLQYSPFLPPFFNQPQKKDNWILAWTQGRGRTGHQNILTGACFFWYRPQANRNIKPYWPRKILWIDWSKSLQRNSDFEANYPIFQKIRENVNLMYGICSAEVDAAPQGSQWSRCFSAIFAQIWAIFRGCSGGKFFSGHSVHPALCAWSCVWPPH